MFTSLIVQIKPLENAKEFLKNFKFTSLIVQIKPKHVVYKNHQNKLVYIPHSSDKTEKEG